MKKLNVCPFRTYTETRPAMCVGQGDVTVTDFMDCLKDKCPAFRVEEKYIPNSGGFTEMVEHCIRLEH